MKKSNQSSRDYSRGNQHRGNSRGQVRGQSRGQDIASRGRGTSNSNPTAQQQNYNTIQHSKNGMSNKPAAKVGNFVSVASNQGTAQPRSSVGGVNVPSHIMNNSLGFQQNSNSVGLSLRQQTSQASQGNHPQINDTGPSIKINSQIETIHGLNQKQTQIYNELFQNFSGDGNRISAIEFFKLCKLCKIYPVVITFEDLKKIVLKNKELWQQNNNRSGSRERMDIPEPSQDNSFPFNEFVNAFRIVGRIGYQNTQESETKKFQLVTQYLQKQLKQLKSNKSLPNQHQQDQGVVHSQKQLSQVQTVAYPEDEIIAQQTPQMHSFQTVNYNSDVRPRKDTVSLTQKKYSEDQFVGGLGGDPDNQYRQPNFFVKQGQMGSIGYDDDKQSVRTATNNNEQIFRGQTIASDVRSEYSGIRGGGRGKSGYGGPVTISHQNNLQTIGGNGQPMIRANTIHRALMGPNQQLLKPKKKMKSGTRKNPHGIVGTVSMKSDIRQGYNQHDMRQVYASGASNQPQRSMAVNSRGQSNISYASGVASSINSKQFHQVRLRADLSVKSNKSPNRYSVVTAPQNNRITQQTINYTNVPTQSSLNQAGEAQNVKQISQSLVAEHRNKNMIGGRPQQPETMSIGLNSQFSKNRDQSEQHVRRSGLGDLNPLDDVNDQKVEGARRDRDLSNSQRSFRIRKYVRSISRGSNISNLSQDHVGKRKEDPNIKTIEHPTDVEDGNDDDGFDDNSNFDHINGSPDIKLKSIEIDDEVTGKRLRKGEIDSNFEIDIDIDQQDDGSGTGHKVSQKTKNSKTTKQTLIQSNSYGGSDIDLKNQRDKAVQLAFQMKNSFLKFKTNFQGGQLKNETRVDARAPSTESHRSNVSSVASVRSSRFVKLKKGNMKTLNASASNSGIEDKDATIARLWTQNNIKDQRIKELEKKLREMESLSSNLQN